jgi:HD-like signal output (HDOD) protein
MHQRRPFVSVDELLDRVVEICPFPAAAQRLVALVGDESASMEAIANAVACDPALATQVLRIANSSGFRRVGAEPVRDLRRALISIGLEALRTMAGSMALLATFASADELSLDLHARSAISGSVVSALMSDSGEGERGAPFLCGLLCEVGALACLAVDRSGYLELRKRTISVTGTWSANVALAREDLEIMRYGVTSRTIGARLLRRHRLPEQLARSIEVSPRQLPHAPRLHRATAFARLATPVLVVARGLADSALSTQLTELARLTSLVDIEAAQLERTCLSAAASAERSLRAARAANATDAHEK